MYLFQRAWPHTLLCVFLLFSINATAKVHRKATVSMPDLVHDFAALSQDRVRKCLGSPPSDAQAAGWKIERTECAWQNRLRVQRWSAVADTPRACVSAQARWWAWARRANGVQPGQPLAWRADWTAHGLVDESGAEKRIAIIERGPGGQWNATEWRWNPSTRAATRQWQAGRWKLLAALAEAGMRHAGAPGAARETRMLQTAWERNLGKRAGEIAGDSWRWQADGLCLRTDPVGLGQQQSHLAYSLEDSRLEQRAAMQLQLARRYPKATWLTPFRLTPAVPQGKGGAKFHAVWSEQSQVTGQLWIPTKGAGPVVRLRIGATVAGPAQVERAAQAIERELTTLASRWAAEHE